MDRMEDFLNRDIRMDAEMLKRFRTELLKFLGFLGFF
jgi:hypothetical protein